ncbi:MAG TPA: AI-2E family transporter [Planctomycetaceae bacterium]
MPPAGRPTTFGDVPPPERPRTAGEAAAAGREPTFVHRVTVAVAIASAFAAGFLLLAFAPSAVILTFAAVWFGSVLYHAAATLARWTRLSFQWAMGAVLTLVVAAAIGFVVLLGWQIAGQIDELARNLGEAADQLRKQLEGYPQLQRMIERPPSPERAMQVVGGKSGSTVTTLLTTPFGFLINVLFIFFTGAYLAVSPRMYREGFVALFPVGRRGKVRRVCSEAGEALWRWTLARLFSMALIGTAAGIGLWLLGVPMAATLALTTALFQFVPNVGPVLAAIPPLLLSFGIGPWTPLYVLLLYIGIELVESWIITPIIHEKEDALPAAVTIVVQLLFGILFGLLGVTFAMPIALVAMIFVQRFYVERGLEGTDQEKPIGAHS